MLTPVPMITDPRGVDLNYYRPLGQTEEMADIERRFVAASEKLGILMTNTCVNYQTVMAPVLGDLVVLLNPAAEATKWTTLAILIRKEQTQT